MKKCVRLRKSSDFKAVYRLGRSHANRLFVLYVRPQGLDYTRVGFVVGRSYGKAVARNRVKRLLREAYRAHRCKIAPGHDLIFIARSQARGKRLSDVEPAITDLLRRGGVLLPC